MKKIPFLLLLLVMVSCERTRFQELDRLVDDSSRQDSRIHFIQDSLQIALELAKTDSLRWDNAFKLYQVWRHVQLDSASRYAQLMLTLSGDDPSRILRSQTAIVRTLVRAGHMDEAEELLKTIKIKPDSSPEDIEAFFHAHNNLISSRKGASESKGRQMLALSERYAAMDSTSKVAIRLKARAFLDLKYPDKALEYISLISPDDIRDPFELHNYYLTKASIYRALGQKNTVTEYLIKASCQALSTGMKDYQSLYRLGKQCYNDGYHERAYKYINRMLSDALQYNYPRNIRQCASLISIMNQSALASYRSQARAIRYFTTAVSLLAILLILLGFLMLKNRKKAQKLKADFDDNSRAIRENAVIKDNMLGEYLELSSNYIYLVDNLRATYRKTLNSEGEAGLRALLHEPSFADSEFPKYCKIFDRIFLSIFPFFFRSVNELMKAEYQFTEGTSELDTAQRILAMLRLGITDSTRISNILHISKGTVYTYRCNLRRNAIDPEHFEEKVQNISEIEIQL